MSPVAVGGTRSALVEPVGHLDVLAGLWRAEADDRLVHALLFEGREGIGKFQAARYFAAGLFCALGPGAPCGTCGPCQRFTSGREESNHPDLLVVDPTVDGLETIRINRIVFRENDSSKDSVELRRTVEGFLDLRSVEGGHRVVILRDAQRMNGAAQNALLKTLEEPSPGTVLVLVSERPEQLLDTVVSRVTRVHFEGLAPEPTAALVQQHAATPVTPELAVQLARWAEGSPGRALRLLEQGRPGQRQALRGLLERKQGPIATSRRLWELEGEFAGQTDRAMARARSLSVIDLLLELVLDLEQARAGVPFDQLVQGDLIECLFTGGGCRGERLDGVRAVLLQCRLDIGGNLTPDAVLDRGILAIARLLA